VLKMKRGVLQNLSRAHQHTVFSGFPPVKGMCARFLAKRGIRRTSDVNPQTPVEGSPKRLRVVKVPKVKQKLNQNTLRRKKILSGLKQRRRCVEGKVPGGEGLTGGRKSHERGGRRPRLGRSRVIGSQLPPKTKGDSNTRGGVVRGGH